MYVKRTYVIITESFSNLRKANNAYANKIFLSNNIPILVSLRPSKICTSEQESGMTAMENTSCCHNYRVVCSNIE